MISKKNILVGSMIAAAVFMAGCNEKQGENQGNGGEKMAITQEDFNAMMNTYMTSNQVAFGQKVMESVEVYQAEQQKTKSAEKAEKMKTLPKAVATEHVSGSTTPEFIIYEYSDFHCPYCQKFHPTAEEFVAKNPNVQWVFRPLPFKGTPLHEVSECVAKVAGNDAFWKFSKEVFSNTSVTPENYKDALARLNISGVDTIDSCYKSGEMKPMLEKAIKDAMDLGIEGTPNSIIQNVKTGEVKLIEGAYPLEELQKAITELK